MSEDEKRRKTTRKIGYIPDPGDTEEPSVNWPSPSDLENLDRGESDSEEQSEYDEGPADLGNSI